MSFYCRIESPLLAISRLHVLSLEVLKEAVYPFYYSRIVRVREVMSLYVEVVVVAANNTTFLKRLFTRF